MEFLEQADESNRLVLHTEKYWVHTNIGSMIDTMCGNSAYVWGYHDPDLDSVLCNHKQGVQFLRARNTETCSIVDSVTAQLLQLSGMNGLIYAVSGSDGVEAALELNYQYWNKVNRKRNKIISFVPGYHGCTWMCKSMRGERSSDTSVILPAPSWTNEEEQINAEHLILKQIHDILKLDNTIGAILMETIPWINGIFPWSQTWWDGVRKLCDQYNILLIADDVWGCFGKVGPAFSHKKYNVIPDIVIIGKALTGGYVPLSCALTSKKVTEVLNQEFLGHGHTWQPQMLGIELADKVLKIFDEDKVNLINQKQIVLIERLGVNFRGTGITKEILVNQTITQKDLENAGLCNTQYTKNSIFLVTPFCADEEYWRELEIRITKLI